MAREQFQTLDFKDFLNSRLFASQDAFVWSGHKQTIQLSGYGSGKTLSLCRRGVQLSVLMPGNEGLVGRYLGPELEKTTQADFMAYALSVPGLVADWKEKNRTLILNTVHPFDPKREAKKSKVSFTHIFEARPGKDHLSSYNLGWFGGDQCEDWAVSDWYKLQGRLRRTNVPKTYAFGVANPKGHNWIYQVFMKPAIDAGQIKTIWVPGKFGKPTDVRFYYAGGEQGDLLLVYTKSAENLSLPDDYLQNLIKNNPPDWVARYVESSTDSFAGRIYGSVMLSSESIHIIDEFKIPRDWPTLISMDAGGSMPWAVVVARQDPSNGNIFVTNEFYQKTILIADIAAWLKNEKLSGIPDWRNARYVCDPENRQAILEFIEHDLPVEGAMKGPGSVMATIFKVAGYLMRKKGRVTYLPNQSNQYATERGLIPIHDSPTMFFFRRCTNTIRENSEMAWRQDPRTSETKEEPDPNMPSHAFDAVRYLVGILPTIGDLAAYESKDLLNLKHLDYKGYLESKRFLEEVRDRQPGAKPRRDKGNGMGEFGIPGSELPLTNGFDGLFKDKHTRIEY